MIEKNGKKTLAMKKLTHCLQQLMNHGGGVTAKAATNSVAPVSYSSDRYDTSLKVIICTRKIYFTGKIENIFVLSMPFTAV